MKKVIVILLLVSLLLVLCSCDRKGVSVFYIDGMSEWISPDGVHYWMWRGKKSEFGLSPRYDSNGQLVIDGGE